MAEIRYYFAAGLKKLDTVPDGFEFHTWEAVTGGSMVKGGVGRIITRGPRKGKRSWRGSKTTTVVVTEAEATSAREAYGRETGKCPRCEGSGQAWTGWSVDEGNRYKPCPECGATGKWSGSEVANG